MELDVRSHRLQWYRVEPWLLLRVECLLEVFVKAVDVDLVARDVGRFEVGEPLHVVPVEMGHEDVDLFTILPAPKVSGLQVWNHRSNKWVRLDAPPGSIIINTGDYMQRITNDRLPSTTHRVGKPVDGSHTSQSRISFPMAVYVWEDEILDVLPGLGDPRYEPIKAINFHTRSTSKFYGDDYAVES